MFHISLHITLQLLLIGAIVGRRVTIDMLPDVALLEIFDCYVKKAREEEEDNDEPLKIQEWHTLVHVCRQWRAIVLRSPRRLDLRLFCTDETPVKETLAVWPPLPIVIRQYNEETQVDNIIVALEHNERICEIVLFEVTNSQLEEVLAAMQQPFPLLTKLTIWLSYRKDRPPADEMPPVVPEAFLGGSAPRLQYLYLERVSFPGLPNLLLSSTDLVRLYISQIPHSGYFSPEAMVCCLSTMTRLETLWLVFESPKSRPVRVTRPPHPPTRSTLLTLTLFWFRGVSEYLEDLMARIDAPLLDSLSIRYFHQLIFETPQLAQFLARTPNIQPPVAVRITFFDRHVEVTSPPSRPIKFILEISCRQPDWQLSSLTQVFSSSFPEAFIHTVEHLYICQDKLWEPKEDDIEDGQWLEVLHPFTAVKDLYLSREFASRNVPALQELAGEALPSLQNIFLEDLPSDACGPVQGAIEKFVAARQLANQPVAVCHWDREQDE